MLDGWHMDGARDFLLSRTHVRSASFVYDLIRRRGCRILVPFKGAVFDVAL